MAESVGLSAKAPDLGQGLTNLNSLLDLTKKSATIRPEIEAAQAELKTKKSKAVLEGNQLRRNLFNSLAENEDVTALAKDPNNFELQRKVQRAISDIGDQAMDALGDESKPAVYQNTAKLMQLAQKRPQDFVGFLRQSVSAGTPISERYATQSRQPIQVGQGAGTALLSGRPGEMGQQIGYAPTVLAPQVVTNQITKAPYVMGGGNAPGVQMYNQGPVPASSVSVQGAGGAPVQGMAAPQTMGQARPQNQAIGQPSGQLSQQSNESPENFGARVQQTQNSYLKAQDQYTNVNSQFGHIPTIKNINGSIIGLLKDPTVDTGAVASYLAGKTNYANLSPKEQELNKLLQQRIQNLSPKSDADAESKKTAYGSLALKKEALLDLVRRDQQWVTTQDLQAKGTLHNGGNAVNPNYGKVADFNSKFSQYAANPNLMRYISVVGEDPAKIRLDKADLELLNKEMGNVPVEKRKQLEQQRQELLKIVNGQQ